MIKKWFKNSFFRRGHRRLIVSKSGGWYLIFTIGLGVFALAIGNNVVYLIESFLLSGLILSGIISERVVSSIEFTVLQDQAIMGAQVQDWLHLENTSKSRLFSVEIGEIVDGDFISLFYIPMITPLGKISVSGKRTFPKRGEFKWDGYAIATSYPFGFAKKMKMIWTPGKRVVWVERLKLKRKSSDSSQNNGIRGNLKVLPVDGEVRPYLTGEDARELIAAKSAMGLGPMMRNRRLHSEDREIRLDLTRLNDSQLEEDLKSTAFSFYEKNASDLVIIRKNGFQKIRGAKHSITQLSLLTDRDCS